MEEIKIQLNEEEYLEYIEKWKLENKELIESGKCKKIFLENLPYKYGIGANSDRLIIDWEYTKHKKIFFIYNDIEGFTEIKEYIKNLSKIRVIYEKNEYEILTNSFKGCKLGIIIGEIMHEFRYAIGEKIVDERRDITIIDIKKDKDNSGTLRKYYKYKCNKCGFDCGEHYNIIAKEYKNEYWILETGIENKKNCLCCGSNHIVVENINSIYKTDPWMIPYVGEEVAKTHMSSSNNKVNVTCPNCKTTKDKKIQIDKIYRSHSITCSCSDNISYPNKFMFNMLKQLNIDFISEYSPNWIKPKRYDFYFKLNNKEYIIEMDGSFHNKNNDMNGQTKEESQLIDYYKDRLANEHGINVIRIDCSYGDNDRLKYIKQNIFNNKELDAIFNIDMINWGEIEKFALSNLVKIACDYKKNNQEITCSQIGLLMGYSKDSICRWLKQGSNLNWCIYDTKEEMRRNVNNNRISKSIISIDKGIIFNSAKDLEEQSISIFRTKLGYRSLSDVCIGRQKTHKGFSFKFTSDLTEEQIKEIQENAKLTQVI